MSVAPKLRCMADVERKPIRWLWKGRIPLGKVTLIAGHPDAGKSVLTIDIAARASTAGSWPDAAPALEKPASVILLSAEDDAEDTIAPRLDAARADPKRVHVMEAVFEEKDGGLAERWPSLLTDLEAIRAAVKGRENVRLVVVDPLSAYLGRADSYKDADVRQVLGPLAALAAKLHVAVVAVMHCNKSTIQRAVHRVSGSIAFVAAARVAWLVATEPHNPERHLMLRLKNNLSRSRSGLAYGIVDSSVLGLSDPVPRISWEEGVLDLDAEGLLRAEEKERERPSELQRAATWLRDRLAGGRVEANRVKADAAERGIAERTLDRAKIEVRVRSYPRGSGKGRRWYWELPEAGESSSSPALEHGGDGDLGGLGGHGDEADLHA